MGRRTDQQGCPPAGSQEKEKATHHDNARLVVGQHDGHEAGGRADGCQDVVSLCLPAHLGHGDEGDL